MCWHNWSEWSVTKRGTITNDVDKAVATVLVQERQCLKCKKTETDSQRAWLI